MILAYCYLSSLFTLLLSCITCHVHFYLWVSSFPTTVKANYLLCRVCQPWPKCFTCLIIFNPPKHFQEVSIIIIYILQVEKQRDTQSLITCWRSQVGRWSQESTRSVYLLSHTQKPFVERIYDLNLCIFHTDLAPALVQCSSFLGDIAPLQVSWILGQSHLLI